LVFDIDFIKPLMIFDTSNVFCNKSVFCSDEMYFNLSARYTIDLTSLHEAIE